MEKLQFQVLYREFLFRFVDRKVLSVHAQGDANKLLGRFAAILITLSLPFLLMVLGVGERQLPQEAMVDSAWNIEHLLIATTMLIVGLFALLSWDSAYPNRLDAFVLGFLPVRANTIFAAKIAALGTALSMTMAIFNAGPGLLLPLVLTPRNASLLDLLFSFDFYRPLAAYWVTVLASGGFVLCCVLILQGIVIQLPQRLFLRISALLQSAVFCLFLCGYFLQPALASQNALAADSNRQLLAWLPSYWFLGLFQELNGSIHGPAHVALVDLAARACIGLGVAIAISGAVLLSSYVRTFRKIVEQPDILPGSHRIGWLPRFGNPLTTAITQFALRTISRSRQHRIILSFYSGIGFAIVILLLKILAVQKLSPTFANNVGSSVSLPTLASSFVMMCFWIIGVRVAWTVPLELRANWIFRITQVNTITQYRIAIRCALYVLALVPLWAISIALFPLLWPWHPAAEHVVVLVLLGTAIAELCLYGLHKIPFSCSYLPGKSNLHITFCLCLMLGLNIICWTAAFELRSFSDVKEYALTIAVLCAAALGAWWRTNRNTSLQPELQFEEEAPPAITSLGLHRDGVLPVEH